MSFYGNVFYELTNAFAKFIVKNSGKTKEEEPQTLQDSFNISAIGLNSSFNVDSGNKWIKLNGENNTCSIYHAFPSGEDEYGVLESWNKISNYTGSKKVALSAGDTIKVQNLYYDKAGHVSKIEDKYFQLPEKTEFEQELDSIENNISDLQTNDSEQDKKILDNLEKIKTIDTKYDADIQDLKDKDNQIAEDIENLDNRIGENSKLGLGDNVSIVTAIGDLSTLNDEENTSIVSAIGNLKNLGLNGNVSIVSAIGDLSTTDEDTVVGNLKELRKDITSLMDQNTTRDSAIKNAIDKICYEIKVDPNEIWGVIPTSN